MTEQEWNEQEGSRETKLSSDAPFLPAGATETFGFVVSLTDEEVSKVYSGPRMFWVELIFSYQDVLGKIRDLHQCFFFRPLSGEFLGGACPEKESQ